MSSSTPPARSPNGIYYFAQGWRLIFRSGIKRYALLPLLLNVLLMGAAFWWLFSQLNTWIPSLMSRIPDWLQWLSYLFWPLAVIAILLIFSQLFSALTNLIAAPFCGLLAEQLEGSLTGEVLPDTGIVDIIKDLPRVMSREWRKLMYYLPRIVLLLMFSFVPVVGQILGPILWFLFGAWMLVIQYCDYPFDNHKISFADMCRALRRDKVYNMQFGVLVSLSTMIPFLNLVILPVAVCGATAMWVDRYRP